MTALICGSIAYDNIMVFHDRFKNHILPDKVHVLSVSFLVPEMRKEFGGCAGNIAYNLKLLGGDSLPMATVGKDFPRYGAWMDECGINRRHVSIIDSEFTAQAFITTDLDANQITAFHPGAMNMSHLNDVTETERHHRRHGIPRWSRRHDPACQSVRRCRHSIHFRPEPGTSHVRRRRSSPFHRSGDLVGSQRLRVGTHPGSHGAQRERHPGDVERAHNHPWREGFRDSHRR